MGEGRPLEYLLNGERVPGVTTITGAFMSRERTSILINWGKSQGMKGAEPEETKQSAGRVGGAVHSMINAVIEQRPPTEALRNEAVPLSPLETAQALRAFGAWMDWNGKQDITWEVWETPLVSQVGFGGTLDAIGKIRDSRVLFDWKSSTVISTDDYVPQVCAYWKTWEEHYPDKRIDYAMVVHLSKKTGIYNDNYVIDDPSLGWEVFLTYKKLRELVPQLIFKERNI